MYRIRLFLVLLVASPLTGVANSSSIINTEDYRSGITTLSSFSEAAASASKNHRALHREEQRLLKLEKRMAAWQHRAAEKQQRIGGIGDNTDRWFWFWIIGWGAGLLLTLLSGGSLAAGGIGIIWILSFAFGSFSLIMWLLKRFQ